MTWPVVWAAHIRPGGETGRRGGLKPPFHERGVRVQIPSRALIRWFYVIRNWLSGHAKRPDVHRMCTEGSKLHSLHVAQRLLNASAEARQRLIQCSAVALDRCKLDVLVPANHVGELRQRHRGGIVL